MTSRPSIEIEEIISSHRRLFVETDRLTEENAREHSLLPDWTRAHVLSHIVGNADSVVRRLAAARENRIVDQYPDGKEGRKQEIEQRATLPLDELVDEIHRSANEVDAILASYPEDGWNRTVRALNGSERPASSLALSRLREVEVHLVDLDVGYSITNWPQSMIDLWLPTAVEGLPERADHAELLAWLIRRGEAPSLPPWG